MTTLIWQRIEWPRRWCGWLRRGYAHRSQPFVLGDDCPLHRGNLDDLQQQRARQQA